MPRGRYLNGKKLITRQIELLLYLPAHVETHAWKMKENDATRRRNHETYELERDTKRIGKRRRRVMCSARLCDRRCRLSVECIDARVCIRTRPRRGNQACVHEGKQFADGATARDEEEEEEVEKKRGDGGGRNAGRAFEL